MYDKAVNRKTNVHFNPRQTLDFLTNSLSNAELTYEVKRRIVRQYLDVSSPSAETKRQKKFELKISVSCLKLALYSKSLIHSHTHTHTRSVSRLIAGPILFHNVNSKG